MNKLAIKTPEGHSLSVTKFGALNEPKCSVLISSATGVEQEIYQNFSRFLSEQNFNAYTFDYGGIGQSKHKSLKKFNTSASSWATNDLESVINHIRSTDKDVPLLLIGHSIGGQLIGLAPSSRFARGILLVGAQTGFWKFWHGVDKIKMYIIWHLLVPISTQIFGYFPGKKLGMSEDLPKDMALEWKKWCCSRNYLFDHHPNALEKYSAITCPVISISAEDDNFAPRSTVDWLTAKYKSSTVTRKHLNPTELGLEGIGHFGFFRSKLKSSIWQILLKVLENNSV